MTFGSGVIMSVADGTCLNATCADFSALPPAFHCVRRRRGPQRAVVARREPGLPQRRAQRQRVPGPVRRQGRHGRPLPLRRRCRADVGRAGGPDHHAGRARHGCALPRERRDDSPAAALASPTWAVHAEQGDGHGRNLRQQRRHQWRRRHQILDYTRTCTSSRPRSARRCRC